MSSCSKEMSPGRRPHRRLVARSIFSALVVGVLLVVLGGLQTSPARANESQTPAGPSKAAAKKTSKKDVADFPLPAPPFSDDIFPCMDCHEEMEPNLERRELEDEHDTIVLQHGPRERWCFDCHNPTDRDKLRLVSGTLISFKESYRLCGQCHGPKLRDWRAGAHGKRTGNWDGQKQYLLCAHCHNPHSPKFKAIVPEPAPIRPGDIR